MGQNASKRATKPNAIPTKSTSFRERTNKAATMLTGRSRSSADVPSTLSTSSFDKSSTQSRSQQKQDSFRSDSQGSQPRPPQTRTLTGTATMPAITTNGSVTRTSTNPGSGFDAHLYNMTLGNHNPSNNPSNQHTHLYTNANNNPLSATNSNTSITIDNATSASGPSTGKRQNSGNGLAVGGSSSSSGEGAEMARNNGSSGRSSHSVMGLGAPVSTSNLAVPGAQGARSADLNVRPRRQTAPDIRLARSSSLAHISDRAPLFTGSTVGSDSSIFYTDFHEDVTAFEAAKTLRKTMKKYSKKLQYKTIEGKSSSGPGSIKSRLNALRPHMQSNSCSTIFVDQTVSQPDLDQILRCAATAIHMTFLWVLAEPELPPYDVIFDERLHPLTSHKVPSTYRTRCPRVTEIYDFLRAFFKAAVLKADVAIVTMVYISRLHNAGLVLQPGNWKRVVLGAVMMASKVWDDQAVWNADYCTVLPDVTVDSMNQLERAVLELLFYNVSVSCAEYAQHYFELRLYAHKADVEDGIRLSPLDVRRAKQLDALNVLHQSDSEMGLKRVSSSDKFEKPLRHLIIS